MTTPPLDYVLVWSKLDTNRYTKETLCTLNCVRQSELHSRVQCIGFGANDGLAVTFKQRSIFFSSSSSSPPIRCWHV